MRILGACCSFCAKWKSARTLSNRDKLLAALKSRGVLSNHEARGIGGSRALGRIHELQKAGYPITVRKI